MRRFFALSPFLIFLIAAFWVVHAQDPALPLKPGSVRFAVIGDWGTGAAPQYEVAEMMSKMHEKFPFEFVITVGDNLYGGKAEHDYDKKFSRPYEKLLNAGVKFYASLGNHDDANETSFKPFNMGGKNYYAFTKGNARFLSLDSNYMDREQLKWLTDELRGAGKQWKIPFFHHPLYSSARAHGSSTELRSLLEPLFVENGVKIVFTGHDHVYERSKPQKGIVHIVEGSSGELRAGNLERTGFEAKGFDSDRTFMLVEISGDQLYFEAISRIGTVIDSGMISASETTSARAGATGQAPTDTLPGTLAGLRLAGLRPAPAAGAVNGAHRN
jgi:predicted MPP superfamily phosphohydrolase